MGQQLWTVSRMWGAIRFRWALLKLLWLAVLEGLAMKVAYKLPRKVAYWCTIRVGAHATMGQWGNQTPDSVPYFTMLARWGVPHEQRSEDLSDVD